MFPIEPVFIFIGSLFLGRWLYFSVLFYEGRSRFFPYKCMHCFQRLSYFPWPIRKINCVNCDRRLDSRCAFMEFSLAFALTFLFLTLGESWWTLEMTLFCMMSLTASVVDLRRTILPDTLTLGGIVIGLVGAFLNPERDFIVALIGCIGGAGSLLVFSYLYFLIRKIEGIGGGDIKMLGWIGALVGLESLFYVMSLACILGFLYWMGFRRMKEGKAGQEIPFGPYLSFATYLFVLLENLGIFQI